MTEPISILGAGAIAAYLSKDGISKLLGPTAELLGERMASFTERRLENLDKIFARAIDHVGDRINEPSQVPVRVVKEVIDNGSFAQDELERDYYAGVLAGSRTDIEEDNRGAIIAQLVSQLSIFQIRLHYSIYCSFLNHYKKMSESRLPFKQMQSAFLVYDLLDRVFPARGSADKIASMAEDSVTGLARHDLVGNWAVGDEAVEMLHIWKANFDQNEIRYHPYAKKQLVCRPTPFGIEVFFWALGRSDLPSDKFLSIPLSDLQEKYVLPNCARCLEAVPPMAR